MTELDVKDLADKTKMSDELKYDPARIAKMIRDSAKAAGIMLKGPDKNCKHCNGRGWIGLRANGEPVVCNCIFFKEDLHRNNDVPATAMRPLNRAERRIRKIKKKSK